MYCLPFHQLEVQHRAGGKATSLARLQTGGFPVPSGFVILERAFPAAVRDTHARLAPEVPSNLLQQQILTAPIPPDVESEISAALDSLDGELFAVRSSAEFEDGASQAWAGIFETILNCKREQILPAVKQCWASLFSERSFSYAVEHGIDLLNASMPVVVQSMVASEVAGTAFSRHPVTREADRIVIESAFGLGEAVVSGAVTPDRFVVSKDDWTLLENAVNVKERKLSVNETGENVWTYLMRSQARKPSLSPDEARELAKIILKIEDFYGFPVDVEWARASDRWYILQARPITA